MKNYVQPVKGDFVNTSPHLLCPPAGIYQVKILSWHCTADELSVWFGLAQGSFKNYNFFESFNRDYKNKTERALAQGAWELIEDGQDATSVAKLARRIVNGLPTLGVKTWGWR
jgi:hypothetical protein